MKLFSALAKFFRRFSAKYEAAQTWSPDRSWIPTSKPEPRFDVTASVRTVIAAKAFHFECNNALAQALGSTFVDYTVGASGLVLMPAATDSTGWNDRAKKYWNDTTPHLNLKTRHHFGCDQGLMAWRWFFDGEIFILKTRAQDAAGKWRPRIQLIESEFICTPPDLYAQEGKTVVDGIAIDANARPKGYWLKENTDPMRGLVTFRLVDAKDIIHIFEPSRPGQMRGISFLHAVLNDLHDLDDLQILEGQAAKQNAKVSKFIETATGEFDPNDDARRIPGTGGTADTGDGKQRMEYYSETLGAEWRALFAGDKVHQNAGERPSETSRQYWNYLTAKICYGVGWSPVVTFSDWISGPQGTVVRGDYDRAAVYFRSRSAVIAAACREVYIYVIGWGIRTERDLADPPADWTNVTIRPPRAVNVDVGRNSAATLAELSVAATNYELIFSSQGLDADEQLDKAGYFARKIRDIADKYKVTPGEVSANVAEVLKQNAEAIASEAAATATDDEPPAKKEFQTA